MINLNIPDAKTRARQSVIRSILGELISHNATIEQTVMSLNRLMVADHMQATEESE